MGFNLFTSVSSTAWERFADWPASRSCLWATFRHATLAAGTPDQVRRETRAMVESVEDKRRILFSCGGGMPPNVSTENIEAFCQAVRQPAR